MKIPIFLKLWVSQCGNYRTLLSPLLLQKFRKIITFAYYTVRYDGFTKYFFKSEQISRFSTLCVFQTFYLIHCGNLRIFLPVIFYVKSILDELEGQNCYFQHTWGSELTLWRIFALLEGRNLHKNKTQSFWNCKMAVFKLLEPLKLISRKIWVAGKMS